MHEYSTADLRRLFNLSPSFVRKLSKAGYLSGTAPSDSTRYTFQDLLILRMAGALKSARISSPKIIDALGRVRAILPPGAVLTSMALAASGKNIVVRERGMQSWEVASGQYSLPLKMDAALPSSTRKPAFARPIGQTTADAHYARAHALEDSDLGGARAAYVEALRAYRDHLEARINLGRLLHLSGELKAAEKVYRQARSTSAMLSFNLAILLEDLDREEEAMGTYREALAQDPHLRDAHFNLSRLYERAGRRQDALRHLLAYKRHISRYGE